jgi:peptidyl-prolyl cis-trans isomerase D
MALIGSIRKRSWLLITFIGLGLALFIVTSMFVGNQIPFLGSQNSTGSIDGEEIDWTEFVNAEEALKGGGDIYAQRNAIWNFLVEDVLVQKEANALGLSVGEDELNELQFGPGYSSIISARFTDPQTRQIDVNQLNQIRDALNTGNINPDYLKYWNHQKREIVKEKLQSRINALVSKSIYTPTWMVEQAFVDKSQTATFEYVKIPFDEVDNSEVTVEESDLKEYLANNKKQYYQDQQTRKLDFIVFNVVPTSNDTLAMRVDMTSLAEQFAKAKNDTIFTDANQGTLDPRYLSRSVVNEMSPRTALTEVLADTLFNAPIGSVVGPIIEGNQMKIAKLIDRRVMPDSATSRHILLNATTPQEFAAAQVRIDSFKTVIESGAASFDSLAIRFSQDPGSASKGGLYENIAVNAFVPAYNDIIFFKGEIGKLYSVKSSYGIHLIEPISRKYADSDNKTERVKIGVISKTIVPTDNTQENMKVLAQEFMANNRSLEFFTKAAAEKGLNIETSSPLKSTDYVLSTLGSGATSRDIIRWAFNGSTSVGDVAPEVFEYQDPVEYYDSKYVVVSLKSITEKGNPSWKSVREEIEPLVYNQKKAEVIKSRISSQDLSSIASTFSTKVDTANAVTFNSRNIPTLGSEPEVIGTAFNLEPNAVSAPIVGNTGIFVVKLNSKSTVGSPPSIPNLRRETSRSMQSKIAGSLIQSMKKNADISDLRSKFY